MLIRFPVHILNQWSPDACEKWDEKEKESIPLRDEKWVTSWKGGQGPSDLTNCPLMIYAHAQPSPLQIISRFLFEIGTVTN